ncbi:hypothetical protein N9D80_02755 [Flavobacteriales bacterium]|nr:hypothetical protein [Flavobacteriales bacterium]
MKKLFTLFLGIALAFSSYASHLMGGQISATYLGSDSSGSHYILDLEVYRDMVGIQMVLNQTVEVYLLDTTVFPPTYSLAFSHTIAFDTSSGGAMSAFSSVYGIEIYNFRDTITFPANGNYMIKWEDCCRNAAIINMTNPSSESASFLTFISVDSSNPNSTPTFLTPPVAYLPVDSIWQYNPLPFDPDDDSYNEKHIEEVLNLSLVDVDLVKSAGFKVVVDAVNSTGGFMIPRLLERMGVACVKLFCEPNGVFPHNPEPLPENLTEISKLVVEQKADLGIVVDPDVDRLAMVCEDGSMFGEEYTLVAISDFVLSKTPGDTVSNLSSTRALRDVTIKHNGSYVASAVGEVNVVEKMKETNAIIGGEGNGGIIYPELHYGRDALVGIALFLTQLAERKISAKTLRDSYPNYFISKNKIQLTPEIDVDNILSTLEEKYKEEQITTIDGLKIDFEDGWIHLRKSNTEPIIRIYAESEGEEKANGYAEKMINEIKELI